MSWTYGGGGSGGGIRVISIHAAALAGLGRAGQLTRWRIAEGCRPLIRCRYGGLI